ncbi:MAG: hypothetical protein JJ974_00590 [Phycisphaerales bacterium]|nr:hypothetical protein [Phycisphaerales bacterium]
MAQKTIFDLDLVNIARWHRRCVVLVMIVLLMVVGMILSSVNSIAIPELVSFAVGVLYLVAIVASIVFVVILQHACGSGWFEAALYGVITVFFSFLILLVSISRAGTILRLAGAKPGFFGFGPDQWDKLRPGHCRGCGYDREGLELLQGCPECQRVPRVI